MKSITGSGKLPYGTLALGTEGIKDAISGFDDAYVFTPTLLLALSNSRAHSCLDENRILKTNAYPPNSLTPKKPRPSSPYMRTPSPFPRHPPQPTSPYPPRLRLNRPSKRPCRLPRWRPHRVIRAWAVHRRPPPPRRHRARCRSGEDMGARRVWVRRERVRRRGDGVWRVRFR